MYNETLQDDNAYLSKIGKINMNKEGCEDKNLLAELGGINDIKSVNSTSKEITKYFLFMTIIIIFGTLLVLCLGIFDKS